MNEPHFAVGLFFQVIAVEWGVAAFYRVRGTYAYGERVSQRDVGDPGFFSGAREEGQREKDRREDDGAGSHAGVSLAEAVGCAKFYA